MSETTLIANGTVVTAEGEFAGDVLIDGETIAAVGRVDASDPTTVIDATDCYVLPGLIDNHTHLSMPFMGMMSSDDYDTGTQAAAAGGVTCLVDFAIQREPDTLQSALEEWSGRADGAAHVDYGFHMAITNASEPVLDDMTAMVDAGICSFKLFMAYKGELMARDDALMACMERARDLNALTMVHAENGDVIDLLVTRALARGDTSAINHALTRPEWVEAEATDRAARIAERVGASLFVVHVTCAAAAEEIEAAQQRGADVTGETCFQYLINNVEDLRQAGGRGLSLRLLTTAARRRQPCAAVGVRQTRGAGERLHRSLSVHRRTEGPRPGQLQPGAQRPGADPASSPEVVGRRRQRRPHLPVGVGRPHLDHDRGALRACAKGRAAARQGRRRRGARSQRAA